MRVYWCVCLDNGCYLIRGLNLLQAEGEKKKIIIIKKRSMRSSCPGNNVCTNRLYFNKTPIECAFQYASTFGITHSYNLSYVCMYIRTSIYVCILPTCEFGKTMTRPLLSEKKNAPGKNYVRNSRIVDILQPPKSTKMFAKDVAYLRAYQNVREKLRILNSNCFCYIFYFI